MSTTSVKYHFQNSGVGVGLGVGGWGWGGTLFQMTCSTRIRLAWLCRSGLADAALHKVSVKMFVMISHM